MSENSGLQAISRNFKGTNNAVGLPEACVMPIQAKVLGELGMDSSPLCLWMRR